MSDQDISHMIGKTAVKVEATSISRLSNYNDCLTFDMNDGSRFTFQHNQDCCEHVSIEDIVGDLDDLVGSPILTAECRRCENYHAEDGYGKWTFYEYATNKGSVTVRWYGSSNGYYAVEVDCKYQEPTITIKDDSPSF